MFTLPVDSELDNHSLEQADIQFSKFDEDFKKSKHNLTLDLLPLYHRHDQLCFYDKSWREKLNVLKPTGLLTLLMGIPSKCSFHVSTFYYVANQKASSDDIRNALSQYIMDLTDNYYREVR